MFAAIEEAWETSALTSEIAELLALKCKKMLSNALNNDLVFGLQSDLNFFVPFEVLFLKRVREQQGWPTVLPAHPLLEVPICHAIDDFPASGANAHIEQVLEECRRGLPELRLPWEERFRLLPATELSDVLASLT